MTSVSGCKGVIDLAWDYPRDVIGQYNRFSTQLTAKLVKLNIELEKTIYEVSNHAES